MKGGQRGDEIEEKARECKSLEKRRKTLLKYY